MYAVLADILEDRALTTEARGAFVKTYDLAKTHNDAPNLLGSLRGLVRTSFALKAYAESDGYFQMLVNTGKATAFDWDEQGARLFQRQEFRAAGDSYEQAAQTPFLWNDWCLAAKSYLGASGAEDKVLEASRACIEKGEGQKDSDASLADAHNFIAITLNGRGVYDEALSHAREAIAINPQNPSYQNNLANAFNGLRRFQEAINASKQAIRLSDGKYSWMHFTLGTAYFETENWPLAQQSFEKAAELNATDESALYNVAVCMQRQGLYRDAASKYEELLRRFPNRQDRQNLLQLIRSLRQ